MYKKIIDKLRNKKIGILGFGKEGQSTYNFLRKHLPNQHLAIIDLKDIRDNDLLRNDHNLDIVWGEDYLNDLGKYDLIIKSPGITLKDIKDEEIKEKVTSQLELLLEVNRDNIIGITGTKGKSTTSSLLYQVLKSQYNDVYLLGNIGIPVLDKIEEYKGSSILVIEMSSDQLEFVKVSPHIGIILNLYEDHLDHAGSVEHYHDSKLNMFKYQNENDIAIYSDDNNYLHKYVDERNYLSKKYTIRFDDKDFNDNSIRYKNNKIYFSSEVIYIDDGKRALVGEHNLKNIMFVMTIAKIKNLDLKKAKEDIDKFTGLKYRMEKIGTFDDITYYNDTIATIPEATISAIDALKEVDTLIFGGMDRKISYDVFKDYLQNCSVRNLICMPTTGFTIGEHLKDKCDKNIFFANTLNEAYNISREVTEKKKICLLSPAASSYEYFKNFEEKGKAFEELVRNGE